MNYPHRSPPVKTYSSVTRKAAMALLCLLALLPPFALAQSVFRLDVLRDGEPAQRGTALLLGDDSMLTSFGLADQGSQWIVTQPDGAALVGTLIATDETADLALLQVNGISGEAMTLALESAEPGRRVSLALPDAASKPGTVYDIQQSSARPARVRHTALLGADEFAAPLLNNCDELLGLSQSPRTRFSRRLELSDEFTVAGDLAALGDFLDEHEVAYTVASDVCFSESTRLAEAEQRQQELQEEQEQLSQTVEQQTEELDAARQAEQQAAADADAARQAQATQEQQALQHMLYLIGGGLLLLLALAILMVQQIKKRKSAQSTAASATANLAKASAQHPDILLVGEDEDGKEHRLKINGNALIRAAEGQMIGRAAQDAHYMLNLEHVSRRHCQLRIADGEILVKDLGSANGTGLNGAELKPQQEMPIADGDELRIGALTLRVIIVQE